MYIKENLDGTFFRKTIERDGYSLYWFRRTDGEVFAVEESEHALGDAAPVIYADGRPTGNNAGESLFVVTDAMRALPDGEIAPYPPSVKFHPIVDEKFRDSRYGVRVLVLGESYYDD
ncbi:hypothetical protein IOC47_22860 [Enterobacter cloacae]|nr:MULTISPECIES: hypothetical protein [Enterobacteriaceae]HBM7601043.1 hypothetical protein [Enterobacter asburiae]HBR1984275.1 hypothetical protein [Klebsiella quasipneumoniae subsp. quasipneumoniae]HCI6708514.1 hypothetical protein [Klebsiella quasipneumoniae subsp. similipneumoniae]KII59394.1 hypothetical protein SE21_04470 [Klebsiella quasipneumoniae]MCD1394655.1 hypothetical protein [Enterobacter cloacae]